MKRRGAADRGGYALGSIEAERGLCFVGDIGRKRIEADMITGPAWTLDGRAFSTAARAPRAGPQFVA
jgi:hypothetical protein